MHSGPNKVAVGDMVSTQTEIGSEHDAIRAAVREICQDYPDPYWRELDKEKRYPDAFIQALTEAGWLAALIPEQYGGAGLGITDASIILEEINRSGANSGAC